MTLKFFALAPATIFKARVNASSFVYPISSVTFDGVTVGSYADIERGLMVLFGTTDGGDDLGRQRTGPGEATATTLYFGRCSEGTHDGEVTLQDNAYITVVNLFAVWSKTPYIDGATLYKDGSLTVGVATTTPPPVANAGVPAAGTIDATTGVLRVRLPSGSQTSFATAAGATITTYAWELPAGVALVAGYALTDGVIEVDCDPGFYWIALAVVDSNGQTHQARTFIVADDPADSLFVSGVTVQSHRRTQDGQTLTVRLTQDLPPGTYPDGTLVALVDGEPADSADRTNLLFWGWHQNDPATIRAQREGLTLYTELTCVDVAGRLAVLPGFPQTLEDDDARNTTDFPAITWAHMVGLTLDLYVHYLLQWHSTALDLTDYFASGTTTIYAYGGYLDSDGGSLWEQIKRRVKGFCPPKNIGCDRFGRLLVRADPLLEEVGSRTANVNAALTAANYAELRFTHTRSPGTHWLRAYAIQAVSPLPVNADGDAYVPTFAAIAPGNVPGQGELEQVLNEWLSPSQTLLNSAAGHYYARINARESLFDITLVGPDWYALDPAAMEWVTITLDAAYAAQRGLSFTAARGLTHEVNYGYPTGPTGTTRTARLSWERETVGRPALTVTQPDVPAVVEDDFSNPPWTPPMPGDPEVWYGDPAAYILWDGAHVMRTWDILVASPTWELVDTGITGAIYDGQYVHVSATTVGMWLLTADGVWWCGDIMATTPSWSLMLTPATVQAADATPTTGVVALKAMFNAAAEPGYLVVATGPASQESTNLDYAHAYSWHTHDYGETWTQVDMNGFLFSDFGGERGYFGTYVDGIDIHRSSGVIFMARTTPRWGGSGRAAVFRSDDGGHTWTKGVEIAKRATYLGILAPFPDIDGSSYLVYENTADVDYPDLYVSEDQWATAVKQGTPAGYFGLSTGRPNSRTFVPDHVILWGWLNTSLGDVLESTDQGASWASLYPSGVVYNQWNTPNGWPPDIDTWFAVSGYASFGEIPIIATVDRFTTVLDKTGNLSTLLGGTWTGSHTANGFALPKVGPNS